MENMIKLGAILLILFWFLLAGCDDTVTQTPAAADYYIGNLTQRADSITPVTITPKEGKSGGAITIYYDDSTALPTIIGTYNVTFDVMAVPGWNAAAGLSAGTLRINIGTNINFTPPGDEEIDLTLSTDGPLSKEENSTITISIDQTFDLVRWYIDGEIEEDFTDESSITISAEDFDTGLHSVTVVVLNSSAWYSKRLTFTVEE